MSAPQGIAQKAFAKAGYNVPQRKVRIPKPQTCRKCGALMRFIEGVNAMVCTGEIEGKNGTTSPCNNRFIFNKSYSYKKN